MAAGLNVGRRGWATKQAPKNAFQQSDGYQMEGILSKGPSCTRSPVIGLKEHLS